MAVIVVIPYHAGMVDMLPRTIECVLSQSDVSVELHLAANNTDEQTELVVDRVVMGDRRVWHHRTLPGVTSARNHVLDYIESNSRPGQYVAFCDADDRWQPTHLFDSIAHMRATGADMSYCPVSCVDETGAPGLITGVPDPELFSRDLLLRQNYVFISTVVLNRDAVRWRRFDPALDPMGDWDYWLSVSRGMRVSRKPVSTVKYMWKTNGSYYGATDMERARRMVLDKWSGPSPLDGEGPWVLLSPFARPTSEGGSPKDAPPGFWEDLVSRLRGHGIRTFQVGAAGDPLIGADRAGFNLSTGTMRRLCAESVAFCAVDTFFQHFATRCGLRGCVLFSLSDPHIFGNSRNINLLVDNEFLRKDQFGLWSQAAPVPGSFPTVESVFPELLKLATVENI